MKTRMLWVTLCLSVGSSAFAQESPSAGTPVGATIAEAPEAADGSSVPDLTALVAKVKGHINSSSGNEMGTRVGHITALLHQIGSDTDSTILKRFLYVSYYLRPRNNDSMSLTGAEIGRLFESYLGSAGGDAGSKAAIKQFFQMIDKVTMSTDANGKTTYQLFGEHGRDIVLHDQKNGPITSQVTVKNGTTITLDAPKGDTPTSLQAFNAAKDMATSLPKSNGAGRFLGRVVKGVKDDDYDQVGDPVRKSLTQYLSANPSFAPLVLQTVKGAGSINVKIVDGPKRFKNETLGLESAVIVAGEKDNTAVARLSKLGLEFAAAI